MGKRFCTHQPLGVAPSIEMLHSRELDCDYAVGILRGAVRIWDRIGDLFGRGDPSFWVILGYNPRYPVAASCSRFGVYLNLGRVRDDMTPVEDVTSRLVEALYHLHEWRVRGINPGVISLDQRLDLSPKELVLRYSEDKDYRALQALARMIRVPHWKELLIAVNEHRLSKGL